MTREKFLELLEANGELSLTIYMPVVPNIRENATRLKFLIGQATRQMGREERRASAEVVKWQKRLEELPDQINWATGRQTLCLFTRKGKLEYYFVPLVLLEEVAVGQQYKVGPLLTLFDLPEPFYVLELRLGQPRLYRAGRQEFTELEMPRIQTTRVARPAELNRERPMDEYADRFPPAQIGKFMKQVAREAADLVKPAGAVVIAAGADALVETLREELCGLNVAEETIHPRPGDGRLQQLHEQALEIVCRLRDRRLENLKEEYSSLAAHAERASGVAVEVFQAAQAGRVRELMFAYGTGVRDSEVFREQLYMGGDLENEVGYGYDGIVEAVIRETLKHGGRAYALPQSQMPVASRVAAVYRY
ncbi:MAG TPA: hypothetical protein VGH44_05900 [Candidatus Saccharimonadia bacterium]|jgi:hypothetical protein